MIYAVAFDANKILICRAHQNDIQNLYFVKAINEAGKKMAWNTHKMTKS